MTTSSVNENDHKFFTTSDLLKTINGILKEHSPEEIASDDVKRDDESTKSGGFELQRRLPDGSTRKADESDIAIADFQSKIKQTADKISSFSPAEKIEWAKRQRQHGNKLYTEERYQEAMDIYLSCLVAMDVSNTPKNNDNANPTTATVKSSNASMDPSLKEQIENEIKFPVLLNLSACTLKLGMHRKTCSFCDIAIDMKAGSINPKVYFRRGKSRMLLGSYKNARNDFNQCLYLLNKDCDDDVNGKSEEDKNRKNEISAVHRELQHLNNLIIAAKKNRKRHQKAMQLVLGGGPTRNENAILTNNSNQSDITSQANKECCLGDSNNEFNSSLYDDFQSSSSFQREYSTLRAKKRQCNQDNRIEQPKYNAFIVWYARMIERGLRKVLFWFGDEEAMTRSFNDIDDGISDQRYGKVKHL